MPKKANRNIRFTECCDTNFIPIAEAGAFRPNLAILLPLLYVLFTDNNTHQNEILR